MVMHKALLVTLILSAVTLAGCTSDGDAGTGSDDSGDGGYGYNSVDASALPKAYEPHVIVGIPDTGINPYHELYFRPERTDHPCTYIEDFPCDIQALPLSVGRYDDWEQAYEADAAIWVNLTRTVNAAIDAEEPAPFFWIPQTPFVAVSCTASDVVDNVCLLDDQHMHGTGTSSSVIMENPDALIAFRSHNSNVQPILDRGIPVDIFSISWGYSIPVHPAMEVELGDICPDFPNATTEQLVVKSSGNSLSNSQGTTGGSVLHDCYAGNPYLISVGGAYSEDDSHEAGSRWNMDVVSYFCRPVAQTREVSEMRESYCGTSFAAPTVAGALSEVLLAVRQHSGYTGGIQGSMMDPLFGLSKTDLQDAMNLTASYAPEAQYSNTATYCNSVQGVVVCAPTEPVNPAAYPVNPAAPWTQWGWGFYDGLVADATIDYLLNDGPVPDKPGAAEYQEGVYMARQEMYG